MTEPSAPPSADPIHACIERWHQQMRGELDGGLDAVLHPDCVFWSPIVFSPQEGRELTKLYLRAAGATLTDGAMGAGGDTAEPAAGSGGGKGFRYTKQVLDGHHAVLEFETDLDGTFANGVDIFTCDDDGLVVELKVMLRPLRAIELVHAQMKAMLEALGDAAQ